MRESHRRAPRVLRVARAQRVTQRDQPDHRELSLVEIVPTNVLQLGHHLYVVQGGGVRWVDPRSKRWDASRHCVPSPGVTEHLELLVPWRRRKVDGKGQV